MCGRALIHPSASRPRLLAFLPCQKNTSKMRPMFLEESDQERLAFHGLFGARCKCSATDEQRAFRLFYLQRVIISPLGSFSNRLSVPWSLLRALCTLRGLQNHAGLSMSLTISVSSLSSLSSLSLPHHYYQALSVRPICHTFLEEKQPQSVSSCDVC